MLGTIGRQVCNITCTIHIKNLEISPTIKKMSNGSHDFLNVTATKPMKNNRRRNVASLLSVFKDICHECSFIMQLLEIKGLRQTLNETNL